MTNNTKELVEKSDLNNLEKYYWGYMYDLGTSYIVPHLIREGIFKKGDKVAEIGSAEGGVLHSFLENGSSEALGTDIAKVRLETGRLISKIAGLNVDYVYHDIINQEPLTEWLGKYDLVILRDVIEHLDDAEIALKNIGKILKKGGFLYVTFPPYNSPYGGHQHTLFGNFLTKLPWIHLFSDGIFNKLIKSGRPQDIIEVNRLKRIRFSPEKMEKSAAKSGFDVYKKEFFIIRPVYKMKFGLNPVKLKFSQNNKFVRNFLCQEASYILKKI